ncbi:8-oxo-dGTP diphosphatase [Fictibacillus phosphorivorans]|uniref:8-oxo-dGTP diphosphatase n=1 Tax=Fictibacillus phosphorivorans TaxID=1221500 RepID=UPI0020425996|nr:8-oxo-dGTP diphosphatase [Fictibacillus phosphorivorans]MCM3720077.1 8-oxo-dGTP diphosphatase [Fictibacillus phosphorivorans]MCM3777767.1 8-oxo-dGTP diphosphatase [Fictibacillus phosphorivorans]
MAIEHRLYTMCMIQDGDRVLLINRPDNRGFPGYLAPGGKIDFPEGLVDGATREVKEETGLHVSNLVFKGIDEYVNSKENVRYMVFNYWTNTFTGDLLEEPPEGELVWVPIPEALELPMQSWFKERFPLFFEAGTFEIHRVWDAVSNEQVEVKVKVT